MCKDSPTERRNTERRMAVHRMTEHQKTQDNKLKNTKHRMTEHRMGPNVKNVTNFLHITFIYSKHCVQNFPYYDITIRQWWASYF